MSEKIEQRDFATQPVLYRIPGMETVTLHRNIEYKVSEEGALTFDIYYPPGSADCAPLPVVLIIAGYPDQGFQKIVGCRFKEMGSSLSWARLMAASGMIAITYVNRDPLADLQSLLDYLHLHATEMRIDETRLGVWASSGNVPLALSLLVPEAANHLTCAAWWYGYTLDLEGATEIADMAKRFGFATPCAGRSVAALRQDVALLLVRAGQDQMPYLNASLDRFIHHALTANLPLTLINYPEAPHAFDLSLDSETSREIIKQTLAFLRCHLLA